jgi:hypothetical protein
VAGPVHWIPRVISYSLINLDTTHIYPVVNDWRTKYFISDMVSSHLAKGTTNLKELNLGTTCTGHFIPR